MAESPTLVRWNRVPAIASARPAPLDMGAKQTHGFLGGKSHYDGRYTSCQMSGCDTRGVWEAVLKVRPLGGLDG